jgi:hypothetical protein
MHYVDRELPGADGRVCLRQATGLVEGADLVDAEAPPVVVGLVTERAGNREVPRGLHGFEVTEVLALQQLHGLSIESRLSLAAP